MSKIQVDTITDRAGNNVIDVVDINKSSQVTYQPAGVGAVVGTVEGKLRESVSVKDFGAVGDWNGVSGTDDTAAIQAALSSGAKRVEGVQGENYKITTPIHITASGQTFIGNGSTITQVTTNTSAIVVGSSGSSFVQTTDVTISGFSFVGADDGLTSTVSYAIGVSGTTAVPYTNSNGCQNIRVENCRASGWCFGVAATGVNGFHITGCYFSGMKYHASLSAGGYGVLAQTCFDVYISGNRFVAQAGDRHAMYISSDPSRAYDSNNVCKQVVVTGNAIDWANVSAISGFESCMQVRGAIDVVVSNNIFKGGYGCIDYNLENGPGENISITGNVFDGVVTSGTSTRGAVSFLRTAGAYRATNVSVTGNSIKISGDYAIGVQLAYLDHAVIAGNTINSPSNPNSFGIYCVETSNTTIGDNALFMGSGNSAIAFAGANDKITINRNQISGSGLTRYRFFSNPTNLKFGYVRTFTATSNGSGTITVNNGDEDVVVSAASDVQGIAITFQPWVNLSALNLMFSGANSNVGWVYNRTASGVTAICGVTNHAGTTLAAATNAYSVVGTIVS